MGITKEQLAKWAKAPSETEEGKCQNAVKRISEVIEDKFGSSVSIFLQGSYKNRTNIRLDSDVDIVILHKDYYFPDISGLSEEDKRKYQNNFISSSYTFGDFKSEVHDLMNQTFGTNDVTRKNKCIRIDGNSYRVDADVVPCFIHQRIRADGSIEAEGVEFVPDPGGRIFSFPDQHYENGVTKNQNTKTMYKPLVRILKNVRNALVDDGSIDKDLLSSFFLECLVWNILPHTHFHENNHSDATRNILETLHENMGDPAKANEYAEVSDLKWLFKANPHLTHKQARDFASKAWNHIGYGN